MKQAIYLVDDAKLAEVVRLTILEMSKSQVQIEVLDDISDRLTQKEAAKFIGVTPTTLVSYKRKGLVPFFQIGNRIYFSRKAIIEVAQKNPQLRRA